MSLVARFRSLPPVVKDLGWVSFYTDAASEMIYPLLPALLLSLGAGAEALGFVEGIAESVSAFVKWGAGRWSDSSPRRKPFVVGGYTLATFVRPLLALVVAPWQVVLVRAVDRVGKGLRSAPRDAIVAQAITAEVRGLAFGFHRMMDNAGAVVGPALAFALARGLGWSLRWIFAAAIVPGLFAVGTLVLGVHEPPRPEVLPKASRHPEGEVKNDAPRGDAGVRAAHLDRRVVRYLAVVALFTLAASADTFLILRLVELGLPAAWSPVAWLSLNAVKSVTNVPGGHLSDRLGRRRTLRLAWLVYGAAYALFPLTRSVSLTWLLIAGYGTYYGLAEGAEKAIVADLAPPEQRGRAFGALHAVTGFAVLPANLLFGVLYTQSPAWAFGASAALALAAAAALSGSGV